MKKRTLSLLAVSAAALLAGIPVAEACTNFIVTPGASSDSTTLVSYSADSHTIYGCLYKCSAPAAG